jgi:hypothetical protein
MRQNLIQRLFNPKTGEMEVITVRTLSGDYQHKVFLNGILEVSKAEIEEVQRKNIELYHEIEKAEPYITDPVITLECIRTIVTKKNYTQKKSEFTYPQYAPREDEESISPHSTSIVLM